MLLFLLGLELFQMQIYLRDKPKKFKNIFDILTCDVFFQSIVLMAVAGDIPVYISISWWCPIPTAAGWGWCGYDPGGISCAFIAAAAAANAEWWEETAGFKIIFQAIKLEDNTKILTIRVS